jgi:hypothetical protein
MSEPYHHVRFRWWRRANLEKIAEEFKEKYTVETTDYPKDKMEMALHKDDRDEIIVTADTLKAYLSNFRAVMSQKKPTKFTAKDAELRENIGKIYTQDRPTPFPWSYSPEPKYEVEKER